LATDSEGGSVKFSFCDKILPALQLDELKHQLAYQEAALVKGCFRSATRKQLLHTLAFSTFKNQTFSA